MYWLVNDIRKEFKPYMTACSDSIVTTLNEPSEITEWWSQYFQNLLTDPNIIRTEITQESEELEKGTDRTEEQGNKNESPTTDGGRKDTMGRNSSVGIATRYGPDGPGIESLWGWDFPYPSRPARGPTQPPIQWVPDLSWE